MPTFRQKRDGNHIIVGEFNGGYFCTWQVSQDGVRELKRRGYRVPATISGPLVQELKARGMLRTNASGITPIWDIVPETRLTPLPRSLPHALSAELLFREEGADWHLALRLPQLPDTWRSDPLYCPSTLANATIIINGSLRLSAARLASGSLEIDEGLTPQAKDYDMATAGEWPSAWQLAEWCQAAAGLNPKGTLFAGHNGLRLSPGTALEPGGAYYLLAASPQKSYSSDTILPASMIQVQLADFDSWQAWSIQIPFEPDEQIEAWCKTTGYRLGKAVWRQVVVSPPQSYTPAGLPIFDIGQEVVVALLPPHSAPEHIRNQVRYQTYKPPAPGSYIIGNSDCTVSNDDDGIVSSISFEIAEPQPPRDLAHYPAPLHLQIISPDSNWEFDADFKPKESSQLTLASNGAQVVRVEVRSAVPLTVELTLGQEKVRHEQFSAAQTSEIIGSKMRDALTDGRKLTVHVDGGAFGSLCLDICPQQVSQPVTSDELIAQARWLAVLLPQLAQQPGTRPLPPALLRRLVALSTQPGCEPLAHIRAAPPSLFPRLWTIAKHSRPT